MNERRQHSRLNLGLQIVAYDLHTGHCLGKLADLSHDGFMLFCESPMAADTVIQFRLVPARPLEGIESVCLGADCLWSRAGEGAIHGWAGFQIIDMAEDQASAMAILLRHLAK